MHCVLLCLNKYIYNLINNLPLIYFAFYFDIFIVGSQIKQSKDLIQLHVPTPAYLLNTRITNPPAKLVIMGNPPIVHFHGGGVDQQWTFKGCSDDDDEFLKLERIRYKASKTGKKFHLKSKFLNFTSICRKASYHSKFLNCGVAGSSKLSISGFP